MPPKLITGFHDVEPYRYIGTGRIEQLFITKKLSNKFGQLRELEKAHAKPLGVQLVPGQDTTTPIENTASGVGFRESCVLEPAIGSRRKIYTTHLALKLRHFS